MVKLKMEKKKNLLKLLYFAAGARSSTQTANKIYLKRKNKTHKINANFSLVFHPPKAFQWTIIF